MNSIGIDDVGSALLYTAGFVVASIAIVALAMWGVFKFFQETKNNDDT